MSTNPIDSTESLPGTGAFLDLSTAALDLTPSEQIEMAELEDDAALFGASVGSSSLINSLELDAFDWSKDLANPGFWA